MSFLSYICTILIKINFKNSSYTLKKLFLSFFLLITIVSNIAVTVVQLVQNEVMSEFKECKNEDTSDGEEKETNSETETDIEKDYITHKVTSSITKRLYVSNFSKKRIHEYIKDIKSIMYSSLPYNPPEA